MNLYYAVTDAVPATIEGEWVLCLFNGIWFVNPTMEKYFINDSKAFGATATKLFTCTDINMDALKTIPWPRMD